MIRDDLSLIHGNTFQFGALYQRNGIKPAQ
jgi:hypothetical protein